MVAMRWGALAAVLLLSMAASAEPDADGDGLADGADSCPFFAQGKDRPDSDGDGVGDDCECGDASGDGKVDVSDIVAAERMIRGEIPPSPLCDANGSGPEASLGCDPSDIEAINRAIFGACFPVCARYPTPPRDKTACGTPGR